MTYLTARLRPLFSTSTYLLPSGALRALQEEAGRDLEVSTPARTLMRLGLRVLSRLVMKSVIGTAGLQPKRAESGVLKLPTAQLSPLAGLRLAGQFGPPTKGGLNKVSRSGTEELFI